MDKLSNLRTTGHFYNQTEIWDPLHNLVPCLESTQTTV